jgi:flagellar hook assembly protein FlgD
VQITGLYTVSINIYNSAGEVVKTIQVQQYSQPINSISLQSSNMITSLQGPGSTILIYYAGNLIGTWDGSNNEGNPVTNGNYEIKVDSVSSTGLETSVQQPATVDRKLSNITAYIYNSAGEVVRTLYNVVDDSIGTQMTNVNLSSSVMNPGTRTNGSMTDLQIFVVTSGLPVTLTWDGTNNTGTNVTPGTYSIQLHWDNGQGETTNITRNVLVTAGGGVSGVVVAEPNVLTSGHTVTTINAAGIANASTLNVKIYTIAGELVKSMPGAFGVLTVSWDSSGMASGVYIIETQVLNMNGGNVCQQSMKVLVIH